MFSSPVTSISRSSKQKECWRSTDRVRSSDGLPFVEPYRYTATAKCVRDTRVIKISRDIVESAIKDHPNEGLAVLKNLTGIIANRLRYAYRQLVPEA